jgi:hypothetical protein
MRVLLIVLVSGVLANCGLLGKTFAKDGKDDTKKEESAEAELPPVRLVGEIASLHREEGFVLIHRYAQGNFGKDGLLSSMSPDGTTASLRLTGERLGRYFAADIQEGSPSQGDLVIARRLPAEAVAPSSPVPEMPKTNENTPWLRGAPGL